MLKKYLSAFMNNQWCVYGLFFFSSPTIAMCVLKTFYVFKRTSISYVIDVIPNTFIDNLCNTYDNNINTLKEQGTEHL